MLLTIHSDGTMRCLYNESVDLLAIGQVSISRASYVEPDGAGQWFADLSPVAGPTLGPFALRSEALAAEQAWLEANRL